MPPRKKPTKPGLSASHKDALAEGRRQGNAVRRYLVALERSKPRRGRSTSTDALKARLAELEVKLVEADPLQRVHLMQERRNLERRIEGAGAESEDDLPMLEKSFIAVAADYGSRKGIDYATWREAGVSAEVLQKAGIHWSRRS